MTDLQASPRTRRARTAVAVAFVVNGLVFASFISRTPALRDTLGLSSAQLGLLLLCVSIGAVAGLPLSGPIVQRLGAAPRGVRRLAVRRRSGSPGWGSACWRPRCRSWPRAWCSSGWAWASGTSR